MVRRFVALSIDNPVAVFAAAAALVVAGVWAYRNLDIEAYPDPVPPRIETIWDHWRTGFVKGAIYGALFMGFVLIAALILRAPSAGFRCWH